MRLKISLFAFIFLGGAIDPLFAEMCNMTAMVPSWIDDVAPFQNRNFTDDQIKTYDCRVVAKLAGISDRKEQVKAYLLTMYKTQAPLKALPDESKTLDALIEIASGPSLGSLNARSSEDEREAILQDLRMKADACQLIGTYCDKRAGEFLISRFLAKGSDPIEKIRTSGGLGEVSSQAEWKADLLKFLEDDGDKPAIWQGAQGIFKAVRKIVKKEDADIWKALERNPDERLRKEALELEAASQAPQDDPVQRTETVDDRQVSNEGKFHIGTHDEGQIDFAKGHGLDLADIDILCERGALSDDCDQPDAGYWKLISHINFSIGKENFLALGLQLRSGGGVSEGGLVIVYQDKGGQWAQIQSYHSGDTTFLGLRLLDVTGDGVPELIGDGISGDYGKGLTIHKLENSSFREILRINNFGRGVEIAMLGKEAVIIDHVGVLERASHLSQASEGRVYRWKDGQFVTDKDEYLDILFSKDPRRPKEFGHEYFEWRLNALKPFADSHPKHFDAQQNMADLLNSLGRKEEAKKYVRAMLAVDLTDGNFDCTHCDANENHARELARESAKAILEDEK